VVHAEDAHALLDPVQEDAAKGLPEAACVLRVEVEGVDILVALRWVLGRTEGAVGASREPLGVAPDEGMIGRGLKGHVEGDVEAERLCAGAEASEVVEGAERG